MYEVMKQEEVNRLLCGYVNGDLSPAEQEIFDQKVQTDSEFGVAVQQQEMAIRITKIAGREGLRRVLRRIEAEMEEV
jgi:hypothetical protein